MTPYLPSVHWSYWVLTKFKLLNFCSFSLFVTPLGVNGTSCRVEETWTCCIWSQSAWYTALMCSVCIGTLKRGCSALHMVPFHKKTAGFVCAFFIWTLEMWCISPESTVKTWFGPRGRSEFEFPTIHRSLILALYFVVQARFCACVSLSWVVSRQTRQAQLQQ